MKEKQKANKTAFPKYFVCKKGEDREKCKKRFFKWQFKNYPEDQVKIVDVFPCLALKYIVTVKRNNGNL